MYVVKYLHVIIRRANSTEGIPNKNFTSRAPRQDL